MVRSFSRRDAIIGAGATGILANLSSPGSAAPTATISETRVISHLPHRYHGWPTLAKRANGELLLVCSGGRESHVCPFGRVELMRSKDEGQSWSWPEAIIDGPIDDRDAGILETANGTLLATTFTSLAYETSLAKAGADGDWSAAKLSRWQAAHHRIDAEQRKRALGVWMKRSTDGGVSWSGRFDSLVNSPHGPIQLADGRLLYAGKELYRSTQRVGCCESTDDGESWHWLAEIPTRHEDDRKDYHELHAVEASNGTIIVHIRNHNAKNSRETLQCKSTDGGRTWSRPRSIGVWGLPSHLLKLRDGRLLMSYGHRRKPLGNQVRISENNGDSWSDAILISKNAVSGDLGYPSTVELHDGSFLSVWYEKLQESPYAQLRQAQWKLN